MGHAHAIFAGHGQDQLLFPAAQFDIHGDATFAGGFQQRLLPVVVQVAIERRIRTRFIEIGRHFIWPDAILIFAGFLYRISAETDNFTFDHHIQTVAVGERLGHFHVEMVFRDF
ncbi:hypothetical protein D3C72_1297410 [compost metagenome]